MGGPGSARQARQHGDNAAKYLRSAHGGRCCATQCTGWGGDRGEAGTGAISGRFEDASPAVECCPASPQSPHTTNTKNLETCHERWCSDADTACTAPCSGARASRLLSLACHKREAAWLYMHLKMKEQGSLRSWTAIQARGTKATGLARHALAKPAAIGQGMERLLRGSTERLGV